MLKQFQFQPMVYRFSISKEELNKLLLTSWELSKYPTHSYNWEKTNVRKQEKEKEVNVINYFPTSTSFGDYSRISQICQIAMTLKYRIISDELVEITIHPCTFPKPLSKENIDIYFRILYEDFACWFELNNMLDNADSSEKSILKYHLITYYFDLLILKSFIKDSNLDNPYKSVENSIFNNIANEFISSDIHCWSFGKLPHIFSEDRIFLNEKQNNKKSEIDPKDENIKAAYCYLYQLILKRSESSFELEDLFIKFRKGLRINVDNIERTKALFFELIIKMLDRQMLAFNLESGICISKPLIVTKSFLLNPPYFVDAIFYLFYRINMTLDYHRYEAKSDEYFAYLFEIYNIAKNGLIHFGKEDRFFDSIYSEADIDYCIDYLRVLASKYPNKTNEAILNAAYEVYYDGKEVDEKMLQAAYRSNPLLLNSFNKIYNLLNTISKAICERMDFIYDELDNKMQRVHLSKSPDKK